MLVYSVQCFCYSEDKRFLLLNKNFQVVQTDSYRGAAASWLKEFRFKHLATDMYLSVERMQQNKAEDATTETILSASGIIIKKL